MRISDWSSDVCSSDLGGHAGRPETKEWLVTDNSGLILQQMSQVVRDRQCVTSCGQHCLKIIFAGMVQRRTKSAERALIGLRPRSEEHTSELQSLMRISYAVFCLKKQTNKSMTNADSTMKK